MDEIDEWRDAYDRNGCGKTGDQLQTFADKKIGLLCECIEVRIIKIRGGATSIFVLELYASEAGLTLTMYFNCDSKTKGLYKVSRKSDFAKMYRLTLGEVEEKRFSKSHQLLGHFLGCRFSVSKYESATLSNGTPYLKVTEIKPETPIFSDRWTSTGVLRKGLKNHLHTGEKVATERRKSGGYMEKNRRQHGDDKTMQAANSLDLEPVLNPTKTLNTNTHNTKTHYKVSVVNDIDTAEYF